MDLHPLECMLNDDARKKSGWRRFAMGTLWPAIGTSCELD